MTAQSELRRQRARYLCPACGDEHVVAVDVRLEPEPVVFGGSAESPEHPRRATLPCPREHVQTDVVLPLTAPPGYLVASFEVAGAPAPAGPEDRAEGPRGGRASAATPTSAYEEARKQSVEAVRRFAASLLTTSTAGVAVYFAVLKYLGLESAEPVPVSWRVVTVLPAALLVAAAAASVWASQPALVAVPAEDFATHRAGYLRSRTRRANVAAGLLLTATLASVLVWTVVLLR